MHNTDGQTSFTTGNMVPSTTSTLTMDEVCSSDMYKTRSTATRRQNPQVDMQKLDTDRLAYRT